MASRPLSPITPLSPTVATTAKAARGRKVGEYAEHAGSVAEHCDNIINVINLFIGVNRIFRENGKCSLEIDGQTLKISKVTLDQMMRAIRTAVGVIPDLMSAKKPSTGVSARTVTQNKPHYYHASLLEVIRNYFFDHSGNPHTFCIFQEAGTMGRKKYYRPVNVSLDRAIFDLLNSGILTLAIIQQLNSIIRNTALINANNLSVPYVRLTAEICRDAGLLDTATGFLKQSLQDPQTRIIIGGQQYIPIRHESHTIMTAGPFAPLMNLMVTDMHIQTGAGAVEAYNADTIPHLTGAQRALVEKSLTDSRKAQYSRRGMTLQDYLIERTPVDPTKEAKKRTTRMPINTPSQRKGTLRAASQPTKIFSVGVQSVLAITYPIMQKFITALQASDILIHPDVRDANFQLFWQALEQAQTGAAGASTYPRTHQYLQQMTTGFSDFGTDMQKLKAGRARADMQKLRRAMEKKQGPIAPSVVSPTLSSVAAIHRPPSPLGGMGSIGSLGGMGGVAPLSLSGVPGSIRL